MTKKLRQKIHIIILGSIIYLIAILANVFLNINNYIILLAFLTAYFIIGGNVVKTAVQNIFRGQVFDENFLMTIATVGAFIIGDYAEAVAVMLFYQVGECFQSFAVGKSRRSIAALMDIRPDFAHLKKGEEFIRVEPSDVRVGETIMVKPGEKIPLDGTVLSGASFIDTAALTGESIPREAAGGD
ncbi:MAG: heavy metal translocating P-type ATPase, partial [Lachnospiraceae bacterium]|nr:heavy metal translocating P-type ATPase [Lachnospiraceae bacterium]